MLGLHRQLAEAGRFRSAQGNTRNVTVLELVLVDNRQGTGPARVVGAVIAIIEVVVDEDHRAIVPAQGGPTVIIMTPVPMHPGGTPGMMGDPVPAEAQPPVPAAVMGGTPAPGFVGNPGPTAERIPGPAAVVVGAPIIYINIGNPDIAVRPLVNPTAVISEFVFVILEVRGEIAL